jgi:riboflavin kinase/FMN adenylyltransferase
VKVAHAPEELAAGPRAVAIGTFDGVHLGHRAVVEAAVESSLPVTAITFDPHPRSVLADESVPLLSSLEADAFVERYVRGIGAAVVAAGATFRFGRDRAGGLDLIAASGLDVRAVPVVERVSSSRIRQLVAAGEVEAAAQLLGRPVEVEGTVVSGDARGAGLGFPTANLDPPPGVIVPKLGIYAGAALDARAAVSVGTNPTYGVDELRIEAFLLDFEGDLYGRRLVVELWRRLRDEAAFASEQELVDQIARDVAETRAAVRPGPTRPGDSTG